MTILTTADGLRVVDLSEPRYTGEQEWIHDGGVARGLTEVTPVGMPRRFLLVRCRVGLVRCRVGLVRCGRGVHGG